MFSSKTLLLRCCFVIGPIIALASLGHAQQQPAPTQGQPIAEIRVEGNHRIPDSTVLYYIEARVGQPYDEQRLRDDYRRLIETGLFQEISLKSEKNTAGMIIIFEVVEPPVIQEVVFEGLKPGEQDEVLEHWRDQRRELIAGSPLNENKVTQAIQAVEQVLRSRGRPLNQVKVRREPVGSAAVRLVFEVNTGPEVRIGTIEFEGNTVFTDQELRSALALSRQSGMFSRWRRTDKYIKERLDYDLRANLLPKYHERGYVMARAGDPQVEVVERSGKMRYRIRIPITEGPVYRLGKVEVKGATTLGSEARGLYADFKSGQVANLPAIRKANEELRRMYARRGFLDMELSPEMRPDDQHQAIDISIQITEGERYLLGRLDFQGNDKTRDKVLRREFLIEENDLFNANLLDQSILRLNQLGLFEPLDEKSYEVRKRPADGEADVAVTVEELDTHSINMTGGLGGISGPYIGVHYQSRNFRGLGQHVDVQVLGGSRTSEYSLSWTDPYWLDTRLTMGFTAFHRRLRYDTFGPVSVPGIDEDQFSLFTQKSTGFQTITSYPVSDWIRVGASYSLDSNRVYDIKEEYRSFALNQLILLSTGGTPEEALEGITRSQLAPFVLRNTRNRAFGATEGSYFMAQTPVAGGPLGGRINLVHPTLEYQLFVPDPVTGRRNTWAFRFRGEHVLPYGELSDGTQRTVPFFERVYLGGEFNLRGFDLRSVAPAGIHRQPQLTPGGSPVIDPVTGEPVFTETALTVGGDTGAVLTLEYRVPVYGPLQLTGFVDTGTAAVFRKSDLSRPAPDGSTTTLIAGTNNVWRISTGVEIQFMVPMINQPFRLILAYNPRRLDTQIMLNNQLLRFEEPERNLKFSIGYSF